jgi:hypothetical protein
MRRFSVCIAALVTAAATITWVGQILDKREFGLVEFGLDVLPLVTNVAKRMRTYSNVAPETKRIVFIGDSTAVSYPYPERLPKLLQTRMREALPGSNLKVISFAYSGMHPSDHYFLSSMVMEGKPHAVVLAFNLASFDKNWVAKNTRPQLAGWVPPGRIPEVARLPMDWMGLSLDQLLLYTAIVRSGFEERWMGALLGQAKVLASYNQWVEGIDGPFRLVYGSRASKFWLPGVQPRRPTVFYIQRRWGGALAGVEPDHAILEVFSAALARYREGDTPVWVYLPPINIEHFEKMGQLNREGLARTIESIRIVVAAAGAKLIDLHQLIPEAGFRDASGHYTVEPPIEGTDLIARAITAEAGPAIRSIETAVE